MQSNFPKIPLLLSAIFFILSCLIFVFLYKAINNNNRESQLREGEWQIEAQRRDEIKALDHSIKIIEEERTQLETHFAKSSDIVPFLDTIERLASKAGARAEVTSVDIPKDSIGLLVGMKASGTFNGLYKFLTLLENSPYELEFLGVDMRQEAGTDAGGKGAAVYRWSATFKIKLLSFVN